LEPGLGPLPVKNIHTSFEEIKNKQWSREPNRGFELENQTIGIIGYGNTGMAVSQKLSGFGVEILAYDKYKSKFSDNNVTEVNLAELMDKSDVISLHIPLTKETENFVDDKFINAGVYVLNPSLLKLLTFGQRIDIEKS
jgi:D-3-phosphoglycerate dehydrogenase